MKDASVLILFHGGRHRFHEVLPEHPERDVTRDFGGIFAVASDDERRPCHDFAHYGPHLHRIVLRPEEVCPGFSGEHRNFARSFILARLREHDLDERDFDAGWSAVVDENLVALDEEQLDRLTRWLHVGDALDDSHTLVAWGAQSARLALAQALGYQAVRVSDEYNSDLIGPGVRVEPVDITGLLEHQKPL